MHCASFQKSLVDLTAVGDKRYTGTVNDILEYVVLGVDDHRKIATVDALYSV